MSGKTFLKQEPVEFITGNPGHGETLLEKVTGISPKDPWPVKKIKAFMYYRKTGYKIKIIDVSKNNGK